MRTRTGDSYLRSDGVRPDASPYEGGVIDVNLMLTPSNGETVWGPIEDPPFIDLLNGNGNGNGPGQDLLSGLNALNDRLLMMIGGLGAGPSGAGATYILGGGGDGARGDGFDLGSFGGGLGLGAIAALVLMLALGSKK